jgi:glutathione synthase/RimK-type ligase-like ATP-grasp enzyme
VILIVAPKDDSHAVAVTRRLRYLGVQYTQIDVAEFPARAFTVRLGETKHPHYATIEGLGEFETVWYRRVGWPRVDQRMPPTDRAFAFSETQAALLSIASLVGDRAFAVNPIAASIMTERGAGKIHQLELARDRGLRIPRTVITSDPDVARAFVTSCHGGAVYKPFLAPIASEGGFKKTVYTNKLDAAGLAALDAVSAAPCLFQELVPKAFEVRATVIGSKIFATEIRSQESTRGAVDFRRDYGVTHASHHLPDNVLLSLQCLMDDLGLKFGCVDLIVRPDGEYVFLEVNQQGQWLWCEERTGQPLLSNFCSMLLHGSVEYHDDTPPHAPGVFPET